MKTMEMKLYEEMQQLKKIVIETEKKLENAPKGNLRITKKGGGVEYYYKNEYENEREKIIDRKSVCKNKNGRYMKKSEISLVRRLAQRDYDTQILKNAKERIKAIDIFLRKYDSTSLKKVYQGTNKYRRELILATIVSDDEFVKQWQAVEYQGKQFWNNDNEIITERGERVRSKSEKIIADKLYALEIPYRYEYPLLLEGNTKIYPDFTILRMPAREEVYLEHLGMMGDNEYVDSVIYKLNTYERNGIYLGVNLFITYENDKKVLNTRALDGMLTTLFKVDRRK